MATFSTIPRVDRSRRLYRALPENTSLPGRKPVFHSGNSGFRVWTQIGRIGLMICFDWFFPEAARTLALREQR